MKAKYLLFSVLFLALGCATTAKYEEKLNSWVGSPEDNLIQSWGPPTQSYPLDNGDKLITYDQTNGVAFAYGMAVPMRCKTTFTVSAATHNITNWNYNGNACKSK